MATSTAPFGDYEPNKDREFVQMFDKHMADEAGKFAYHAGQAAFHANQMSHYAKLINYHDQKTVGQAAQIIGTVAHGAGQIAHEVQADRALEKRIFGESGTPADKDE